uniref:Uncharacterized protein n=1 Tax=Amphimedon queenslandica TaxID=400682 RepID=A0A1X7UEU2_AMPQE
FPQSLMMLQGKFHSGFQVIIMESFADCKMGKIVK